MKTTSHTTEHRERVFLVGLGKKRPGRLPGVEAGQAERESLLELAELARSAGAEVTGSMLQMRERPDPATLVGEGKLEEIEIEARMHDAPLVIFDTNLTPTQQRNIEEALSRRVIDRTQIILDIFARHARSREGQLQVELAQLNYLLPRLAGRRTELSRLGGGIGTRGPGEQKLETDRRRIREKIGRIQKSIEMVRKQRSLRREKRQAVPLGTVALVGYTNAGKSTLFNALSKAGVLVSSKMFATLDPTVRAVRLPSGRRVLLSDTVGFIRALPPALIAAFRATLEEVQEASLLLHVTDISNSHFAEQDAEVEKVLADLGVSARPRILVCNKIDRLPKEELAALVAANPIALTNGGATNGGVTSAKVFVSALKNEGLEELLKRMDEAMPIDEVVHMKLLVPMADGRMLALIHALGRVISSEIEDSSMRLSADVPESLARRLNAYVV
jgi:GTP-binding protein HflX